MQTTALAAVVKARSGYAEPPADPPAETPPKIDLAARARNLPPKDPYHHKNGAANLPPWDGRQSSESKPGEMLMFRGSPRRAV